MKAAALLFLLAGAALPADRSERFALILSENGALRGSASRKDAVERRARAQQDIASAIADRGLRVTGSMRLLANAIFVAGPESEAMRLTELPGVVRVQRLREFRTKLSTALDLVNIQGAWSAVNGSQNAGTGVKIAILDSGVDQTHPAFSTSLPAPPNNVACKQPDRVAGQDNNCAYVNGKVIVARSYVHMLVGSDPADSRPDDLSPRDRVGHGTALAMIAAGARTRGPAGEIEGVAPRAWLGNYKVFGSPGVNGDYITEDVILQALEDAASDGMHIANISLGAPALWLTCKTEEEFYTSKTPCDLAAFAVKEATRAGMLVVTSSGNEGDFGLQYPAFNSIDSPGVAPEALTVGATTNRHIWYQKVRVEGANVPANVREINGRFGRGPAPSAPITAPVRDVSKLGDDGKACSPLGNDTLAGAIALIDRGSCQTVLKINNATKAGAVGVILINLPQAEGVYPMEGLEDTGIPMVLIPNSRGVALRNYLAQNADARATVDPALVAVTTEDYDTMAFFSSRGPAMDTHGIKPEVVAPATDIYTATQKYDPNGDMYDASGFTAVEGTSFAAPLVSGIAAIVKQRNPNMRPGQIKSAIVNTALNNIDDLDGNQWIRTSILDVGAGKVNATNAARTNVTVEPSTISLGVWRDSVPSPVSLTFCNHGTSAVRLQLSVQRTGSGTSPLLSTNAPTVGGGQCVQQINVRLEGSKPRAGVYEGVIEVSGGTVPLTIPYTFFVPDGTPYNLVPVENRVFAGQPGSSRWLTVKVVDRYGIPVVGAKTEFWSTLGGGRVEEETKETDDWGMSAGRVLLGDTIGEQEFAVRVNGNDNLVYYFGGRARVRPTLDSQGVTNAASGQATGGFAPGSYITLWGRGLSEIARSFSTPYLPLSIAGVSVSFDVASQKLGYPGRLTYVSDNQVNVQIPWELQGTSTALMKLSIGTSSTAVVRVPIASASPGMFEYADPSGRMFVAALDEAYRLVGSGNPAQRGRVLQLYANGLGAVDNQPASGEISPSDPLARTRSTPVVTVGGRPAAVQFSGLAPGFVGLYQVNVVVPQDAPTGVQPVIITIDGVASRPANVPVQ